MKKRGIQLAFGMIFSIILIAAVAAVAFYSIGKFLEVRNCSEISLFYDDFQRTVSRAWNSEITRDTFSKKIPSGIERVCFGDVNQNGEGKEYEFFKRYYSRFKANMFLYPTENTCDNPYKKIEHLNLEELGGFSCFPVENNEVEIKLEKNSNDALVRIVR